MDEKEKLRIEHAQRADTNRILTLPNLLSFFRILLIPLIIWLYFRAEYWWAFGMLLLSGAVKERETANSLLESSGMSLSEEYFFVGGVELLDHEEKLEKLLAGMKQELACIVERNGKRFLAVIVETTERDA